MLGSVLVLQELGVKNAIMLLREIAFTTFIYKPDKVPAPQIV